jgi:hypothetical protein
MLSPYRPLAPAIFATGLFLQAARVNSVGGECITADRSMLQI